MNIVTGLSSYLLWFGRNGQYTFPRLSGWNYWWPWLWLVLNYVRCSFVLSLPNFDIGKKFWDFQLLMTIVPLADWGSTVSFLVVVYPLEINLKKKHYEDKQTFFNETFALLHLYSWHHGQILPCLKRWSFWPTITDCRSELAQCRLSTDPSTPLMSVIIARVVIMLYLYRSGR